MRIRNAPWAGVDPQPFVPLTVLGLAANLGVRRSSADCPAEPADPVSRLENVEVVAELGELISEREARDARAEHDYPSVARPAGERRTCAGVRSHQIPGGERAHHQ